MLFPFNELILRLDFYLWIITILLNYFFMIKVIPRFKAPETAISGKYFKGIFLFFLIHGFSRIAYFINDYFIMNQIVYEIGVSLGLGSIVAFMYYIESTIYTKSHHIFFIYGIFSLIISIISVILTALIINSVVISIIMQYATLPVLAIVILWIYLYTMIKTVGRVRENTIIIFIGIILFMIGQMAHTPTAADLLGDWVNYYASPLLMIIGLTLFYIGLTRSSK